MMNIFQNLNKQGGSLRNQRMMKSHVVVLFMLLASAKIMIQSRIVYEQQVLDEIREIPMSEFPKLLKLLHVLKEEFFPLSQPPTKMQQEQGVQYEAEPQEVARAVAAVEKTWGSIPLDQATAKYVAEDKELEYDI